MYEGRRFVLPPRRIPVAMLSARVRALPLALTPALDGDDDSGALGIGGGGKVVGGLGDSSVGSSPPKFRASSVSGEGTLRSRSGRRRDVISLETCEAYLETKDGCTLPSTARLISTARRSPTKTYSRRKIPSSSVSPGIVDDASGLSAGRGFVCSVGLKRGDCDCAGGDRGRDGPAASAMTLHKPQPFVCTMDVVETYPSGNGSSSEGLPVWDLRLNLIFAGGIIALGSRTSGGITRW